VDADALLADLDADQRAAVETPSLLVAVIAGAGSGKTRVLTRRIAHRIAVGTADPRHTLALTFTREAAGELRRRLRRSGLRDQVDAGTFHSVMLGVLRQRRVDTDRPPVNILADRRRVVRDVVGTGRAFEAVLAEIDWAAARGITSRDYARLARDARRRPPGGLAATASTLADYETEKHRRGVIDFDDVLLHTLRELRRDRDFADATRWRFRHLHVDEAQDLNPLQQGLLDQLRSDRDDLFLVGDPAQAISGFNGADPALLVDVDERFPGIEVIRLPVNHRCTPQIVQAGVHVLDRLDLGEALVSARGDGQVVQRITAADESSEASGIARLIAASDPNLIRSGQMAVLARTRAQLRPIADALSDAGLPVRTSDRGMTSPIQEAVRTAAYNGSPSRLRAWAHDTLEQTGEQWPEQTGGRTRRHETGGDEARRVAQAALDFLRDTPRGDGAAFRTWVATTNPFDDPGSSGVEVLTFHAAKGREWQTVVVSGVESGLVPHRSAGTVAAKAEEARLLYVAITRATDRLILSHASRRGGYARTPSLFLEDLDLSEPEAVAPPRRQRSTQKPDRVLLALRRWRDDIARRNDALPEQLMSDRDLASIAAERPTTAEELANASTLGPIRARRLAPELTAIIETAIEAAIDTAGPDRQKDQSASSTMTGA
jgi:DNA helicase-2/ATP-dependent DNA helicase PcrA